MNMWSQRQLTMFGRILVIKTMILSQFNYLLSCLPTPSGVKIKEVDRSIMHIVRANKSAQKLSQSILQNEKNKAGLALTLFKEQSIGMKIA